MRKRMLGTVAAATAVCVMGFTTTAAHADDTQIIIDNVPTAVDALVAGVQETADTLTTTQSAVATSAALGQAVVDTGSALVAGTEQFGALGLGLLLVNLGVQQGLAPYLGAIDDPSTAADLINPDDLNVLADNLGPTTEFVVANLATAAAEGLKGNLVAPGFLDPVTGTPAALGNTLALVGDLITGGAVILLTQGTSFEGLGFVVPITVLVAGAAAGGALGDYLQQIEDAVAPIAEAGAPVSAPIIELLEGL